MDTRFEPYDEDQETADFEDFSEFNDDRTVVLEEDVEEWWKFVDEEGEEEAREGDGEGEGEGEGEGKEEKGGDEPN